MSITFEGASSDVATTTADTSLVVSAPAGSGGRLYAFGYCGDARTITPPDAGNWTLVYNNTDGTDRTYCWMRTDDAQSTYTFTISGGFNSGNVGMIRLGGASTDTPTYTHSTGPHDVTQTCPTLTSPADQSLFIWLVVGGYDSGPCTADKGTERIDVENSSSVTMLYLVTSIEGTGSITGPTVTSTGYGPKRLVTVAIPPASGGGGGGAARRRRLLMR